MNALSILLFLTFGLPLLAVVSSGLFALIEKIDLARRERRATRAA